MSVSYSRMSFSPRVWFYIVLIVSFWGFCFWLGTVVRDVSDKRTSYCMNVDSVAISMEGMLVESVCGDQVFIRSDAYGHLLMGMGSSEPLVFVRKVKE